MTNQELFELLSRLEGSAVRTLKITRGDFSLEISKDGVSAASPALPSSAPVPAPLPSADDLPLKSPLAGVFYRASQPGAAPYVSVGDRVQAGQTLCLMEAMKMISEIPAPCDCIITAIEKENGALAAYDEPLLRYRPC